MDAYFPNCRELNSSDSHEGFWRSGHDSGLHEVASYPVPPITASFITVFSARKAVREALATRQLSTERL